MDLVRTLGVDIGVRQAGTPAAARAAEAIAEAFRELGLEPRFQEFDLLAYEHEEPELEIDGEPVVAGPCSYGHATDGFVEGELRFLGTFTFIPKVFEEKVFAVVDGERTVAHLIGNPAPGGGAIPFGSPYGAQLAGVAAFLSYADADRLAETTGAHVRLRTAGRIVPRRDRNVIAELPGESDEAVVVGAHFDSVWRGPGTVDNATGVEGLRRVAERLAGGVHPRGLRFVAFAAEEIGLLGSRFYATDEKIRGRLDGVVGMVNLDCIGHGAKLMLMVGPDELRDRAVVTARELGIVDRYGYDAIPPGAGTDHYYFAGFGIPAVSISFMPYAEYHLPEERLELVDAARMNDAVELATRLVESQLADPVRPKA